jgi:glucose/mannose transport system substrate-binding protein
MRRPPSASRALLGAWFATLIAVAGALGCRSSAQASDGGDAAPAGAAATGVDAATSGRPIELLTWWSKIGDADALGALQAAHQRRYPGDVLIDATAGLSSQARSTIVRRMRRDEPPDTFLANAGRDFMRWVLVDGIDDGASKLTPLDGVVDDVAVWRRAMPKQVLDLLSFGGKLYGVPTNIHRLNTVFYNRSVFRKYGLGEPKTLDDLKRVRRRLAGTGVHALAIGTREPWTLELLAFECLLIAREGAPYYEAYFGGHLRADDPPMLADLDALLDLVSDVNEDHAQLSWLQAVDLVVSGKAAMTVMGDWARGAFVHRGMRMGEEYGEIPFPGTEDVFVFTSDVFGLPKFAKNRDGAIRLLQTMGSADGQRAMNGAKDALSARTDVPPPDHDTVLEQKFALFKKGPLVLALSGLVPGRFADDVATGLADAVAQHDSEPAVHALRSRYALLR